MDVSWFIGQFPVRLRRRKAKALRNSFTLLRQNSSLLLGKRDTMKKTIIKDLIHGKKPPRESQKYLKQALELEQQVNDLLKCEHESSDIHLDERLLTRDRLVDLINQIAVFLEEIPFEHSSMFDSPYATSSRISTQSSMAYGSEMELTVENAPQKSLESQPEKVMHSVHPPFSVPENDVETEEQRNVNTSARIEARVKFGDVEGENSSAGLTRERCVSRTPVTRSASIADDGKHKQPNLKLKGKADSRTSEAVRSNTLDADTKITVPGADMQQTTVPKEEINFIQSKTECKREKKPGTEWRFRMLTKFTNPRYASRAVGNPNVLRFSKSDEAGTKEKPLHEANRSRKTLENCTIQMILEVMKDAEMRRINVYGTGGAGKTTILKALADNLETKNMFDAIIWLRISRSYDKRDIQHHVAAQLGLSVADCKSDLEVAQKCSIALQSRKFLLIVDDLPPSIDLNEIGIPLSILGNGSVVISATRSEIGWADTACEKEIRVDGLSREEAWEIFRKQVNPSVISSPDICRYARIIAAECGGLPLLTVVSGRAMREESDALEWRYAAKSFLSSSPLDLGKYKDILKMLEFSYHRLVSSQAKNCFKYFALFPEDHKFEVIGLVDHYIQEGLIVGSLEDAHKTGVAVVKDLVHASLLESVDGGLSVIMHRVIRDMALRFILSEEDGLRFLVGTSVKFSEIRSKTTDQGQIFGEDMHQILFSRTGLTQLPVKDEWKKTEVAFLVGNEISRLSEIPSCSNLVMLFLQRNTRLRTIAESFFDSTPSLRVVNLSRTKIRVLPASLFNLHSLQALILQHCDNISVLPPEVGNLALLEVLDLWGTQIYNLPSGVARLTRLQQLRVSFYGSIDHSEYRKLKQCLISSGVISSLLALKELSVDVHPGDPRWETNARVVAEELGKLGELVFIHLCFPEVKTVELFTRVRRIDKLSRFNIVIGNDVKRIAIRVPKNVDLDYKKEDRRLRYVNGNAIPTEVQEILVSTTAFYLDHHCTVNSLSDFQNANIKGLKFCVISECMKLKTVVEKEPGLAESILPNLVKLSLHYLPELSSLWDDHQVQLHEGSFKMLKTLSVHKCPKLKYVVAISMLCSFSILEELVVEDCANVKEIVKMEEKMITDSNIPKLKRLVLDNLPQLISIWTGHSQKIEEAIVHGCPNLKDIQSQIPDMSNRD